MTDFEHSGRATTNWLLCDCEECEDDREALFEHIKACAAHPAARERDGNRRESPSCSGSSTFIRNLISGALALGSKFGRGRAAAATKP